MAGRRKKQDSGGEEGGAPAWMVTYGDLMSLLLTFFVLLLSFSTISEKDFNEAIMSLQGALGVLTGQPSVLGNWPEESQPRSPAAVEKRAQELQRRMQVADLDEDVKIDIDREGGFVKITLPGEMLFESGQARLRATAFEILEDVADVFADLPNAFIEARGHTDNVPVGPENGFSDNWDLSFQRANAVVQYLRRQVGMAGNTFESVACGSDQPIATNTTPAGRAENRRVELHVRGDFDEQDKETIIEGVGQPDPHGPAPEDLGPDFWESL